MSPTDQLFETLEREGVARYGMEPINQLEHALQCAALAEAEAAAFIAAPGGEDAVRVRRWDERAKAPGLATPLLEHFRTCVETCLRPDAVAAE